TSAASPTACISRGNGRTAPRRCGPPPASAAGPGWAEDPMAGKKYDVKSLALADEGRRRIAWADERMPVLRRVREEFARDKPLRGLKVSACLHVTTETATTRTCARRSTAIRR